MIHIAIKIVIVALLKELFFWHLKDKVYSIQGIVKISQLFSIQSILGNKQDILWFTFNSILIPLFTVISLLPLLSQISIVNNTIIIINIKIIILV